MDRRRPRRPAARASPDGAPDGPAAPTRVGRAGVDMVCLRASSAIPGASRPLTAEPHTVPTDPEAPPADTWAVRAAGISKVYQIYDRPQDRLKQAFFRRRRYFREFWALRGVSLEVARGETVGIIGRNGSGKSTLLQIICGTLQPTAGTVAVQGRVSALLELGSGFNMDFTGRENVFLNASILGLERAEVEAIYDDIAAFANIGDYIDQPIKTYSSGMVIRLAFAVAINVRPDILIVDEALAVGDEAFQRRCLARLDTLRDNGATVLFVSHSSGQVISLCDRVVLLDQGEKLFDGPPRLGMNCYQKLLYMPAEKAPAFREALKAGRAAQALAADRPRIDEAAPVIGGDNTLDPAGSPPSAIGQAAPLRDGDQPYWNPGLVPQSTVSFASQGAEIERVQLTTTDGERVNMLIPGEVFILRVRARIHAEAWALAAGLQIKTTEGVPLAAGSTIDTDEMIDHVSAGTVVEVVHRFRCLLTRGTYFFNCGLSAMRDGERYWLHRITDAGMFQMIPDRRPAHSKGPVDLGFRCEVRILSEGRSEVMS